MGAQKKLLKVVRRRAKKSSPKDEGYIKGAGHGRLRRGPPLAEKAASRRVVKRSGQLRRTLKQFSKISKIEKLLTYMPTLEQGTKIPSTSR